jgi:hypothetical protein
VIYVSLPAYSASLQNFFVIPSTESEDTVMAMSVARNSTSSSPCARMDRRARALAHHHPPLPWWFLEKGRESRSSCERALSERETCVARTCYQWEELVFHRSTSPSLPAMPCSWTMQQLVGACERCESSGKMIRCLT